MLSLAGDTPALPVENTSYFTFAPNVAVEQAFWCVEDCARLEQWCLHSVPWFRVRYVSDAHGNDCVTPCWTSFYTSLCHGGIPTLLRDTLIQKVERYLGVESGYFNVAIMRLYANGKDNIAYHSDDRIFLEQEQMIIASATFGLASRTFSMIPVDHAWETTVRDTQNARTWKLGRGDLLVMRGRYTQLGWLHAVKPQPECRQWRININLRRIRSGYHLPGLYTFYKYCVLGDHKNVAAHLELENEQQPLETAEIFGASVTGMEVLLRPMHGDPRPATLTQQRLVFLQPPQPQPQLQPPPPSESRSTTTDCEIISETPAASLPPRCIKRKAAVQSTMDNWMSVKRTKLNPVDAVLFENTGSAHTHEHV